MRISLISLGVLAVVSALVLLLRRGLLVSRVRGGSMLPAYRDGDVLLAVRRSLFRRLRAGDVVVCRVPEGFHVPGGGDDPLLVKRVAAVGGEPHPAADEGRVRDGMVHVVGDSADHSLDSNVFGALPEALVVGVVLRRMTGVTRAPQSR
ncbi:S26 family signal peptidase [Actinomadura sp. KC345]|uniref:S26 family signal peptidase n=1 Tax=Actinomadura sp. KC345 TaxID=2530371 RepID=UPI00104BEA9F|nr:S26 family signal peptidase [Actinomadura sp. KC345]TDC57498.1 S26 family signal peptidase [Actinomadura sp. KC345]